MYYIMFINTFILLSFFKEVVTSGVYTKLAKIQAAALNGNASLLFNTIKTFLLPLA